MTRTLLPVALAAAFFVSVFSGCTLGVGNFAGKRCDTASDCPMPYVCAAIRPELGLTCELLSPPGIQDGGEGPSGIDYCRHVKPALDRTCLNNCHGPGTSGSGYTNFQLDFYESDGGFRQADGGLVLGAREMAERISLRGGTVTGGMPLFGSPQPTSDERTAMSRWVSQGAPFCLDAGL